MRYERKIPIVGCGIEEIILALKTHPACFSQAYPERRVNNIYLDDYNLSSYSDNLTGQSTRVKFRIRWYGDAAVIKQPVLEVKIKSGNIGTKRSFLLKEFSVSDLLSYDFVSVMIKSNQVLEDIACKLSICRPVLINSYVRNYFSSFDKKFRLTLDENIVYSKILKRSNINCRNGINLVIAELKYEKQYDEDAASIMNYFNCRTDKYSKYVSGIVNISS